MYAAHLYIKHLMLGSCWHINSIAVFARAPAINLHGKGSMYVSDVQPHGQL
jgi:hypothetical protein